MPSLIEFLSLCCPCDNSVLSELSHGNPQSEYFQSNYCEWSEIPITDTSLIFTTTLKPSMVNPHGLTSMDNMYSNQQSRFEAFLYKNRGLYSRVYAVAEKQKNGNFHWHGFINLDNSNITTREILLARMRKYFGRSEITQPYKSYKDWYNYIMKSPIHVIHNIPTKAEDPNVKLE